MENPFEIIGDKLIYLYEKSVDHNQLVLYILKNDSYKPSYFVNIDKIFFGINKICPCT